MTILFHFWFAQWFHISFEFNDRRKNIIASRACLFDLHSWTESDALHNMILSPRHGCMLSCCRTHVQHEFRGKSQPQKYATLVSIARTLPINFRAIRHTMFHLECIRNMTSQQWEQVLHFFLCDCVCVCIDAGNSVEKYVGPSQRMEPRRGGG